MIIYLKQCNQAILAENRAACMQAEIACHLQIARAVNHQVLADLYENFSSIIGNFLAEREEKEIGYFAISHFAHEQLPKAIHIQDQTEASQASPEIVLNNPAL